MTVFSIVMPVYNVEKYIKKCLESIEKQTFKDFEVLCVDDCGTDNSVKIIEEFVRKDNRFKIIKHEKNKGVAASRNTGMDNAQGEYLIFVDPDDWMDDKELEKIYYAFEESHADSVWFNSCIFREAKGTYEPNIKPWHKILNHRGFVNITPEKIHNCTEYLWDKAFKLSKIWELNVRFSEGVIFEDYEFYFKFFSQVTNIYYMDEILYTYRVRMDSLAGSARKGLANMQDLFTIDKHIYDFIKEKGLYQYKKSYLAWLGRDVKNVLLPGQYEKCVRYIDDLFKYIDFPNAFEDCKKEVTVKS